MKHYPKLLEKHDSDLAIMSISIDSVQTTKNLLEQKPKPWDFLIPDNKNWTFYNDNRKENSYVEEFGITYYPKYLLFNKQGELTSTPFSGIAGAEIELGGIFGLDLTFKTEAHKEARVELSYLIIPYTILTFLILGIIFIIKRFTRKKNAILK